MLVKTLFITLFLLTSCTSAEKKVDYEIGDKRSLTFGQAFDYWESYRSSTTYQWDNLRKRSLGNLEFLSGHIGFDIKTKSPGRFELLLQNNGGYLFLELEKNKKEQFKLLLEEEELVKKIANLSDPGDSDVFSRHRKPDERAYLMIDVFYNHSNSKK